MQNIVHTGISWARNISSSGFESIFIHPKGLNSHWSRPDEGYVKLKTNGVVFFSKNYTSIGGVIKDDRENWRCGFVRSLGERLIFQVEAKAMLEDLHLAWDKGYKKIEMKCDKSLLMKTILARGATNNAIMELRLIYGMFIRGKFTFDIFFGIKI